MRPHPYLRAYMAGVSFPCFMLLFLMIGFTIARHVYDVPAPLERVIVFPMAVVPNAWGLWNVIHVRWPGRLSLGAHGAVLPFLLAPATYAVLRLLGIDVPETLVRAFLFVFPAAVAAYYLFWKHLVGFLNDLLGIA